MDALIAAPNSDVTEQADGSIIVTIGDTVTTIEFEEAGDENARFLGRVARRIRTRFEANPGRFIMRLGLRLMLNVAGTIIFPPAVVVGVGGITIFL